MIILHDLDLVQKSLHFDPTGGTGFCHPDHDYTQPYTVITIFEPSVEPATYLADTMDKWGDQANALKLNFEARAYYVPLMALREQNSPVWVILYNDVDVFAPYKELRKFSETYGDRYQWNRDLVDTLNDLDFLR